MSLCPDCVKNQGAARREVDNLKSALRLYSSTARLTMDVMGKALGQSKVPGPLLEIVEKAQANMADATEAIDEIIKLGITTPSEPEPEELPGESAS